MLITYSIIFIVSCLVLVRAGTWIVGALTRIARFLEWSEFSVSFILMAFATSIPELFVGINAALHQHPELAFGTIIGSNIINLTLAVAIAVFIGKNLEMETVTIRRSAIYTSILAFFPILLMLDGEISRIDGIVLLLALIIYFSQVSAQEERFTKVLSNNFEEKYKEFKLFLKDIGRFFGGLFLLLISAEGIVWSITSLAEKMNLSLFMIGILIVALGANLPELSFGIKAIIIGRKDMVLGNLMGSVVANSTLILGLTFIICPLKINNFSPYFTGIIFTAATALFFYIFSRTDREINRKEGLFLLVIYIAFILTQILIN
ncbi:sodium:calcium antiporter [Patescibacteria group bacterium]|nr:sodium:calcium antiporter [Patescibacteria group bacterium]